MHRPWLHPEAVHSDSGAWHLGRRPALDGLRGFAILLVLMSHAGSWSADARDFAMVGNAGVTLFFTLSGFLITALLIEERQRTRRVDLTAFYGRRVRRLLPAFLVFLPLAGAPLVVQHRWPDLVGVVFYVGNWIRAAGGVPLLGLSHTWSLSIEEQFYLVWPIAFLFSARWRRGPVVVAVAGVAASLAATVVLFLHGASVDRLYFGTDTRAVALLAGCLLAFAAPHLPELRSRAVVYLGCGVLAGSALAVTRETRLEDALAPTLVAALSVVLIWGATSHTSGPLTRPAARYLGVRSYGLYLWHYPVLLLFYAGLGNHLDVTVMALVVAVGVTELSWRLVETRFLVRRPRRAEAYVEIGATEPGRPLGSTP